MSNKTQNFIAFLVVLLASLIYFFPAFLGKSDIPIDIRDLQMYPWQYYHVDKKVKKSRVLEAVYLSGEKPSDLKLDIPPFGKKTLIFQLKKLNGVNFNKLKISSDISYDLVVDIGQKILEQPLLNIELSLIKKKVRVKFLPRVVYIEELRNKSDFKFSWRRIYFTLDEIVNLLNSVNEFGDFNVEISIENKRNGVRSLSIAKDLGINCLDLSSIEKVHNVVLDDVILIFAPIREYFSNRLKNWKLPFWNNYILTGHEFLSEPQVGFFHPIVFLSYRIFDYVTAHLIVIFISFVCSGLGAYFLARYWNLSFFPSLLTGIVYMFHPFNVTWFSFGHVPLMSAVLPSLILFYDKSLSGTNFLNKHLLISCLLIGLILLSGHLQHVYYTLVFFFLYAVFRFSYDLISKRKLFFRQILNLTFVFLFGILIGAIVLIPFFSLYGISHRVCAWSHEYIKMNLVSLREFFMLLLPYRGAENKIDWVFFRCYSYFGFLPFLLSLIAFCYLLKDKLVFFLFTTIIISLLICTGSPLFFLVKDFLPGFKQMQHYRFLQVYSFAVPFLAGIGFQYFINYLPSLKRKIGLLVCNLVILITVCDLIYNSSFFVTWSNRQDCRPVHKNGSIEFLLERKKESKEPFRVLPFTIYKSAEPWLKIAIPNTLQPYGIESVSGYSSFLPKDLYSLLVYANTHNINLTYPKEFTKEIVSLFPNTNIPYPIYNYESMIVDLLNAKYFLVPNGVAERLNSKNLKEVYSGDCTIFENIGFLPRAFLVPDFKVISSNKKTIVELDSDRFNPREEVILMIRPEKRQAGSWELGAEMNNLSADLNSQLAGRSARLKYNVKFLKYEPENITLNVNAEKPGFLVLGHNFNDNWKVKINGKEGKHYQANLVQRAVYLPKAGNYTVEFYYFPKLFLIGFSITCSGLLILAFLSVYLYLKRDKYLKKKKIEKQTTKQFANV